jgi:hypothetical protein
MNKTWQSRLNVADAIGVMDALRKYGLPLDAGSFTDSEDSSEESSNSKIVLIAEVYPHGIGGIIATPSGEVSKIMLTALEDKWFWSFAARYYYVVSGNMADRQLMANMLELDSKLIKGKCVSRKKSESISGFTLDGLLLEIGYSNKIGNMAFDF